MSDGDVLAGRYVLGEVVGQGGMATVHRAHDPVLGRDVAVKIVAQDREDAETIERFAQEARLVAQLDHPHIVPVYDFHRDAGHMFYVMPLVEGHTLADILDVQVLSPDEVARLAEHLGGALSYSHVRGVVHRDIKPENILVSGEGDERVYRLTDFGIAISMNKGRSTTLGMVVGTPAYLSPEQIHGARLDGRTDIYTLGAVLYESLTGRRPIVGAGLEWFRRIVEDAPLPIETHVGGVPEALQQLVLQCLEKSPDARPQRASEVVACVRRLRMSSSLSSSTSAVVVPDGDDGDRRTQQFDPALSATGRVSQGTEVLIAEDTAGRHVARGARLLMEGDYAGARDAFERAADERQRTGATDITVLAEHTLMLANISHKLGSYDEALAHCDNGLSLLGDMAPPVAGRLAAAAGLACTAAGRFDDATDWISEGLEHIERCAHGDPRRAFAEAMIRRTEGNMLVGRGRAQRAIGVYEKSLSLIDATTEPWEHSIAQFNVGEACTLAGDYERAIPHLHAAHAAKTLLGDRWGLAYVHASRAQIHLDLGDVTAARREAEQGLALAQAIRDPKLGAMHGTLLARVHLLSGALDRAQARIDQALADAMSCDAAPEVIEAHVRLGELHMHRADLDAAAEAARVALDQSAGAGSSAARGASLLMLARIEHAAGRDDRAVRHLEKAERLARRGGNPFRVADAERLRRTLDVVGD